MSDETDVGGKIEVLPEYYKPKKRPAKPEVQMRLAVRREKVVALRSAGMSWREIGKRLDVSAMTARKDFMAVVKNIEMDAVRKAARYARHHMSDMLIREWMAVFKTTKNMEHKAMAHDKLLSAAQFQVNLLGLAIKSRYQGPQQNFNFTVALDKPLQSLDEDEREKLMGRIDDLDPTKEIKAG